MIAWNDDLIERKHVVARCFDREQALQLVQLFWHLRGQVVRRTPVFIRVVEFPDVIVEGRGLLAYKNPRRLVPCDCGPALVCKRRGCLTSQSTASRAVRPLWRR
jgi:hypothetical protein